jgi:serine/threonine protein kinase
MNEARAAGTLGHPNIVESTDMGFLHNHVPYIVFEFLEGALLTDEIYRLGGLPVRRAVRIATQIASALHAAHNAGVVHRDLKSENVFLTDKDEAFDHVKVLDFGISRFLQLDDRQKNMVMGTPEFMAPEQITDPEHVDRRADIYALGVILYEMLSARRPFAAEEDPRQLMTRIVHEAPAPLIGPEIPHKLAEMILTKLLAKRPDDRFQTMSDVEAALESFITRSDGTPVPTRRSQPLPQVLGEETGSELDIARSTGSMPRPVRAKTPFSDSLTPVGMQHVMLPASHVKKPYVLYALTGVGLAVGFVGVAFGLMGRQGAAPGTPVAASSSASSPPAPGASPAPASPRTVPKIAVQLDADAPNAHVTFRRRVAPAPTSLQINATDVVELVEVSAPGHKTARFWLTFDRPTHLRAHLVKGTGIAEATEEETLVALGEVAPAKTVARPAVQSRAPTAKVAAVQHADPTAAVPRKIGKSSVDVPAMTTEPVVPAAEPAAPAPAPAPPAPPAPEPPKVEPPEAKLVPVAAPEIDAATTTTIASAHRGELDTCIADGRKRGLVLKGTITLQLQVDPAGKVHRVQVQSSLKDPRVAACVVKSANSWRFPSRSNADVATVSYPFAVN